MQQNGYKWKKWQKQKPKKKIKRKVQNKIKTKQIEKIQLFFTKISYQGK